ncbi:hypothetical protein OC846_006595 [Tilletia horrida]|uniref:Uncharacterized protein n=1 Tax=Tilletia horrida TaxID=155126 RepID=A0AAN6JQG5_9BASI|nr:hypothetical protein OC846_006595 [Tilletia horrida]KAK0559156.1 hypothetical protein OC861_006733 [Tilletia horrida]
MDLIHGSFLSPRKATQDQRVFKYALRGCGLRFLPSYIAALPQVPLSEATCMDRNVDESSLPRDILHVTLREERARVGWWLAQQANKGYIWGKYFRYSITMRELNSRSGVSPELAERSSLSGWQHFARHVALWEYAQMGYFSCPLREFDFPQVYEADPLCYQDGPQFAWKPGMDLAELRSAAEYYSRAEEDHFEWNVKAFGIQYQAPMAEDTQQGSDTEQRSPHLAPRLTIQRAILGTSLEEAFSKPLVAFVHLPRNFREYAEVTLAQSPSRFADVTLPEAPCHKPNQYRYTAYEEPAAIRESDKEFVLSYWILPGSEDGRLTPYWQLVNRETDEIHEIVHAFRCGHRAISYMSVYERNAETCRHASRRLVRPTERSERDAFKAWACTRAQWYEGNIYEDMASWVVLDVPRWLVFGRLKNEGWGLLNREELPAYAEDMDAGDEIFTDEPTTAAEWIERVRDGNIPEWAKFYRCRLPPVEMLAEIRALAAAR